MAEKKKCSKFKKEIYNDKYKCTRDRLFGLINYLINQALVFSITKFNLLLSRYGFVFTFNSSLIIVSKYILAYLSLRHQTMYINMQRYRLSTVLFFIYFHVWCYYLYFASLRFPLLTHANLKKDQHPVFLKVLHN